jgi:hypothetical protein
MATLEEQLTEELKNCMRAGDKIGLAAVRMVRTEVMKRRTAKAGVVVDDELVLEVLRSYAKQLQNSADEFLTRGVDASDVNISQPLAEIAYLQRFLPQLASEEETAAIVDQVLATLGTVDPKMAGKITGLVMKDHKGKVDPGLVSKVIRAKLG